MTDESSRASRRVCMLLGATYPPDIRVEKEAKALLEAGHDVTVLCRGEGDESRYGTIDGVGVIRLGRRTPIERASDLASGLTNLATGVYPRWLLALRRGLRAGADVVHVHDLPLVRTALVATRDRDVPVVADLHENYPEAVRQWRRSRAAGTLMNRSRRALEREAMSISRLKRLERACVARVDRVLTVCEEGKGHYVADCGATPEEVTVVSNTVDLDRFDAGRPADRDRERGPSRVERRDDGGGGRGRAEDGSGEGTTDHRAADAEFRITYVGRLGAHRGLETVLDALAALDRGSGIPARLVIVGPDSTANAAALRERARTLEVADRLSFTGWVDFDRVPEHMAASDVCVVPHAATPHTETTVPHKLFQYMAAARPVLVTDVGPLERIVEGTNAGIVVPAGNGAAMANAFGGLYERPASARELGRNGRRAIEERYQWARDAEGLRETYRDLRNE